MGKWAPCKRREFIRRLKGIGFLTPEPGGRHFYIRHGTFTLTLPSNAEYSVSQVKMLLLTFLFFLVPCSSWGNETMWKDSIVEDVRKVREENAAKFNYNLDTRLYPLAPNMLLRSPADENPAAEISY